MTAGVALAILAGMPNRYGCNQSPDPSPAEIAEACEEIQATWSEVDELRRRAGGLDHVRDFIAANEVRLREASVAEMLRGCRATG